MSIMFASKLSALRREKNITQKTAAEELGISQALLSHYEKGIRECNLDFVVKAAEYYEVTTDYLLGLSDSRYGSNELYIDEELPGDSSIKPKTLLRAFSYLLNNAENESDAAEIYFSDFFSLAIQKYIAKISEKDNTLCKLCDISVELLDNNISVSDFDADNIPICIKTVKDHSSLLIEKSIKALIK